MNFIALDRRMTARLLVQPRVERKRFVRRVIVLPGTSRNRQPGREPTKLGSDSARPKIEIADTPAGTRWDGLLVARAFLGLFIRLQWYRLTRKSSPTRTGEETRKVFEHLGGLWMKVGQLMSLRRDVLPDAMCNELAQLQHRAIGFEPELAIMAIEKELGAPIDEIFSAFDPMPFAAASLSQVHTARLRDGGHDVVVKVLRPGIRRKFDRDMRILHFIAFQLDRFSSFRKLRLKDAITEFQQIFFEELDYRYEAANMRDLRKATRGHKIYIPKLYSKLSTANVIVMERIFGVLMSDYIRIDAQDPERVKDWCKANNIDRKRVGSRLLISFMRQLFENNLFHADLHPGNIILLRDSRVALIDLGSVGSLDREFLTLYRGLQRALAEQDYGKAADLQLRLCVQLPSVYLPELRTELARCLRIWSGKTKIKSLSFKERSINTGAAEVSRILSRYGAQQTWEFLKIARTLSTLDASLQYLHAELNYIEVLQEHFSKNSRQAFFKALNPKNVSAYLGRVFATIDEYHLLLAPSFRASAFTFGSTLSKVSKIFAIITKIIGIILSITMVCLVYRYLGDHPSANPIAGHLHVLDAVTQYFSSISIGWAEVVIILSFAGLIAARQVFKELLRPEARR